jgi:hypothetical protein
MVLARFIFIFRPLLEGFLITVRMSSTIRARRVKLGYVTRRSMTCDTA